MNEVANVWSDGRYLDFLSAKFAIRQEIVLKYINLGIFELGKKGLVNMANAKERVKRHHELKWIDEKTAEKNNAILRTLETSNAKPGELVPFDKNIYVSDTEEQLIHIARSMMISGANEFQVEQALMAKKGLTFKDAKKLYKKALASFRKVKAIDLEFELNRSYARLESLYAQAQKNNDYQSSLVILREMNNFFKIEPPPPPQKEKTQEEIEKEGGIVRAQIYLPDNGRDIEEAEESESE